MIERSGRYYLLGLPTEEKMVRLYAEIPDNCNRSNQEFVDDQLVVGSHFQHLLSRFLAGDNLLLQICELVRHSALYSLD